MGTHARSTSQQQPAQQHLLNNYQLNQIIFKSVGDLNQAQQLEVNKFLSAWFHHYQSITTRRMSFKEASIQGGCTWAGLVLNG
jgi:hypothetical protein